MKRIAGLILVLGGLFVLPGMSVSAAEPEPTPTPKPHAKSKTLADIAGNIKLGEAEGKKDEGKGQGGVVIDNTNLKEMGKGAVISEGGSLAPSIASDGPDGDLGDEAAPEPEANSKNDEIERLEAQLKAIKKAQEEHKKANIYNGAGPQYRSPGTRDPLDIQREQIEAQLEAAKKGEAQSRRRPRTR